MHDIAITHSIVEALTAEIGERPTPAFDPLPCDSWIARSVMQKAIRRGMLELALRAAAQLSLIDGRTLWRRLLITALEDLGPKHLETTARIVFGWSARSSLSRQLGTWPLVAELIRQCCVGPRSQVANDLWNIGLHHPSVASVAQPITRTTARHYRDWFEEHRDNLFERAAVVITSSNVVMSEAHLGADDLCGWAASSQSELSRITYSEAFKLTRVPLAPLLLIAPMPDTVQSVAKSDDVSPVVWNGPVPTFALDQYTRVGRAALRALSRVSEPWQAFVQRQGLSDSRSVSAFAELVFRLDGAALAGRDQQSDWLELHEISTVLGSGIDPSSVREGLAILRAQLSAIDQVRSRTNIS